MQGRGTRGRQSLEFTCGRARCEGVAESVAGVGGEDKEFEDNGGLGGLAELAADKDTLRDADPATASRGNAAPVWTRPKRVGCRRNGSHARV